MDMIRIVTAGVGVVSACFWLILFLANGRNYHDMIQGAKQFRYYKMPALYNVGFGFMRLIHFDLKKPANVRLAQELSQLNGGFYGEFHLFVLRGEQYTTVFSLLPVICTLSALRNDTLILAVGGLLVFLIVLLEQQQFTDQLKLRKEEIENTFPNVLSKMTLLVKAGMPMREAWKTVSEGGNGVIYEEMRQVSRDIDNNMDETKAYEAFAARCGIDKIQKFVSLIIQNLDKGGDDVEHFLKDMTTEMWELKKHNVKIKGERAKDKLMMPAFLMFAGILIMIIVPMFVNLTNSF